jgi:hypothetical protein
MSVRAHIVPAARGARWLGEGWQMFRAAPLGWLSVVFVYLFGTQAMALVPGVGLAVALVAVPGLSVGLMAAARASSRGGAVQVALLLEGFRNGAPAQLVLGAVYLACSVLIFAALALVDEAGALRAVLAGSRAAEPAEAGDVALAGAAAAALYVPVAMLFWFAPVLAAWHSVGPGKALFFSFVACLLNWRAFLAYAALAALLMLAAPLAALALPAALLGTESAKLAPLLVPLLLVLMPTLFASFYASYCDVFGGGE